MADDERQEMLEVLGGLLEWEAQQGGWEAPCWTRARRLRDLLSEQLAAPELHPGLWTGVLWEKRIAEQLALVRELDDEIDEAVRANEPEYEIEELHRDRMVTVCRLEYMVCEYQKLCGQMPPGWGPTLADLPPRPETSG